MTSRVQVGSVAVLVGVLGLLVWLLWPREVQVAPAGESGGVGGRVIEVDERAALVGEAIEERAGVSGGEAWAGEETGVAAEVKRRLGRFGVIDVEMEGWSLAQVVTWLRDQMVGLGSGDLEALAELTVRGIPKGAVTILHEGQTNGWAVLELAAAQAGMRVEVGGDGRVVLVEDGSVGAEEVAAAEAALERGLEGVQVFLTTKLIELQEEGVLEDQVLDAGEFELLVRQLSQTQGVDLMSAPSVVTRAGQEAQIEVGETGGEAGDEFKGIRLGNVPFVAGEQYLQMDGTIGIGGLEGDLSGETGASVTEYGTVLVNGQTAALLAVDGENGKKVLALVTGKLVDTAGAFVPLPGGGGE